MRWFVEYNRARKSVAAEYDYTDGCDVIDFEKRATVRPNTLHVADPGECFRGKEQTDLAESLWPAPERLAVSASIQRGVHL